MMRDELIEVMLAAYHPDWNDADWPEAWRSEERTDMGRALDAYQAEIRRAAAPQPRVESFGTQPWNRPPAEATSVRYCTNCGAAREGGVFTVCDDCWERGRQERTAWADGVTVAAKPAPGGPAEPACSRCDGTGLCCECPRCDGTGKLPPAEMPAKTDAP